MVTMVSGRPLTAMKRGRTAGGGARFRTRAAVPDVPAVRLTRLSNQSRVSGVAHSRYGALSHHRHHVYPSHQTSIRWYMSSIETQFDRTAQCQLCTARTQ